MACEVTDKVAEDKRQVCVPKSPPAAGDGLNWGFLLARKPVRSAGMRASAASRSNMPGQVVQLHPSPPLAHPHRIPDNSQMSLSIDEIQRQLQEIERQEQNLDVLLKTNQGRRKIQRRLEMRAGDDKIIRACDESLHAFVKQMWPVLEPATKFVDGWALEAMCAHLEAVTDGRIQNLLINVPPGSMKALDSDTPVMTMAGWKRHGDLSPGDFVYGPDGQFKRVVACTAEVIEDSYSVKFDDGAEIIAGAGHEWAIEREEVTADTGWKRQRKKAIVTTPDLRAAAATRGTYARPDRIPLAKPIYAPPQNLLIDPYLFGVWLGDGGTGDGCIYSAEQDIGHFSKLGAISNTTPAGTHGRTQAFHRIRIDDLRTKLRMMGLLGKKSVPEQYLRGSIEQRIALLQGLMDTDGHASGQAIFTNKNKNLIDAVHYLASSLGAKPFVRSRYTTLNGEVFGPHYTVSFTPPKGMRVFRLDRKQEKIRQSDNPRTFSRYVESVTPVGSRTVKCIQVEGGIYLAGYNLVPTHNSLLTSVFWPAWEWGPKSQAHQSYVCFSYSSSLTERDNERFRDLIISTEYQRLWGDRFAVRKKGAVKVTSGATGFKLASSVGGVGTGERARRIIADDLHNVKEGESKKVRESTVEWFRTSMLNRLNDMATSAIVVIMQRVHEMDVSGYILAEENRDAFNFVHLCIQNEIERKPKATLIGWKDPRTKKNQLYWPARLNADQTAKLKKKMGIAAYTGQYQQRPSPAAGMIIGPASWKVWTEEYWPPFDFVVASLDSAYTEKEENDPSGFTVWGVFRDEKTRQPNVMLMYSFSERLEMHDLVTRVADLCGKMNVDRLLIEAKASGHSVYQEMRRLFSRTVACQLVVPKGDKVQRAHSVAYLFDDGLVGYPKGKEYAVKVVDEFAKLPKGEHDDLVDSGTQALNFMRNCGWLLTTEEGTGETEQYRYGKALQDELEPVYDV